jgi:dolichyl-phosphate-mannose-protein mannosyltransferase
MNTRLRLAGRHSGQRLWVSGLLILALGVRLFGAVGVDESGWVMSGCDEPFIAEIAPILATGDPLHFPVFFYPPAPALITAAMARVWAAIGGGGELGAQCRAIALIFSVATVGLVYLLGRFWGQIHARIAMALYAVTMIAVLVQGNVQVYSTFFVALALYCVLRADAEGRTAPLALAGISLGLGVASKYSPIFFSGMLLAPSLLSRSTRRGITAPYEATALREETTGETRDWLSRVFVSALLVVIAVTLLTLWLGIVERDEAYGLIRQLYDQQTHVNPFEYHLEWIDRLYSVALSAVALIGLLASLTFAIPQWRGVPAWDSAKSFYALNRLWIVPVFFLILTAAVVIGLPALANVSDFVRYFVYIAKGAKSGDSGMFPEHSPAVSYIGGYIPENTGLPLFAAGLIGIVYALIRRDRRALIILAGALPAYIILELTRVKINRYSLELIPVWCVLAAVWLGDFWHRRYRLSRLLAPAVTVGIVIYSLLYALAWAQLFSPRANVQREAGRWLNVTVPKGTSLGVGSSLLVTGSPELLPDAHLLRGYHLLNYRDDPEYVLLPNGVYAVVQQYVEGLRHGYVYTPNDWFPSLPTTADLDVLTRIVQQNGYELVKEFAHTPSILGIKFGSQSLTGRTLFVEHSPASGLRVYRRIRADR